MFGGFERLKLRRPLAVFDLETTGTNPSEDRIVEIAIFKLQPDGGHESYEQLVNPGVPIPAAATRVHCIADEDVVDKPLFAEIAPELNRFLHQCDLAGFNVKRFDLPCLAAEFRRAGLKFEVAGRAVLDAQQIFHAAEPRNLSAAVQRYLGCSLEGAHAAFVDVVATAAVLEAQLEAHPELPQDVAQLDKQFRGLDAASRERAVRWCLPLENIEDSRCVRVAREAPSYLRWMLEQDFLDDTKALVSSALAQIHRRG